MGVEKKIYQTEDGPREMVLLSDYAALEARHAEAIENGAALSACCCPYQSKGGLWHDDRGHYRCGYKEDLAVLHRGRRTGEGDVEHGREDKQRCLDCGHEWRDEG